MEKKKKINLRSQLVQNEGNRLKWTKLSELHGTD